MLGYFPVLQTKAFTQNIPIKLADSSSTDINLSKYDITETPCMLIFENSKKFKVIP